MTIAEQSATAAIRRLFPVLHDQVYLASCSLGAPSLPLQEALERMLAAMHSRSAWPNFEHEVEAARHRFADLIGADPAQIALVPNVAIGVYQAASTLPWAGARRRVLVTTVEWPGGAHVWQAQRRRGADVIWIDTAADRDPRDDLRPVLDERVQAVSIPLVSYLHGVRFPAADLTTAAHGVGATVVLDASHAVGVQPVDVTTLGCDFLVAAASKYLLGLPGVAFLYARHPAEGRTPTLTGWLGRTQPHDFDTRLDWPSHARRFETGTPAIPAVFAATAGLSVISAQNLAEVREHILDLTYHAATLLQNAGERINLPPAEARGAHVALPDPRPDQLAAWLASRYIVVAPRGQTVRLSFHCYSTPDEVGAACDAIAAYRRRPGARGRL